MKVTVWDTYVKRSDGRVMHFDILVPTDLKDNQIVFDYGRKYLKEKPFHTNELTANECVLCHFEVATAEVAASIKEQGFYIVEMANCH